MAAYRIKEADMRRGTTPTIIMEVDEQYDLSMATDVWATFGQDTSGTEITKQWSRYPDPDDPTANQGIMVNGQYVTVKLSQEETLEFVKGSVKVQVKMKQDDYDEGTIYDDVVGTVIKKIKVDEILSEDVM